MIFLPGTDKQLRFLQKSCSVSDKKILIAGGGTELIGSKLMEAGAAEINMISDNSYDILEFRLKSAGRNIKTRQMEYDRTDFRDGQFDLIYAQAAFSTQSRRKIFKEAGRILKREGIVCIGEIIRNEKEVPRFIDDIWNASGVSALTLDVLTGFYKEAGFSVSASEDLSYTLNDFYSSGRSMLEKFRAKGTDDDKHYYKKLINKISHETNAYLNLGGKKYIKFRAFILKRTV